MLHSTQCPAQRLQLTAARQQWLCLRARRNAFRVAATPQQEAAPLAAAVNVQQVDSSRRQLLLAASAALAAGAALPAVAEEEFAAPATPDTTITDKVYLDIGIASTAFKPAGLRTLGDKTVLPDDAAPAGRLVIGLYGKTAPATVANFLTLVKQGGLEGTCFSRISPGEYIQAGRQGARRQGEVEGVAGLTANSDLSAAVAFKLPHYTPGTVSLSLSENDEEPQTKDRPGYRPTEFLITTGPGPVPRLDGLNVVFGRVLEGLEVVGTVAAVPSFQPDIRSQQLNRFAAFLGDERADKVARRYGRPLKAVIITGSGVLEQTTPAADIQQALATEGQTALLAGATADLP